ncbi:FecR family protein [Runella sp.]|uniref:FecR family protein n=1 Tax=Runella sp. TaxID=1960881 RepID=UPI003D1191B4
MSSTDKLRLPVQNLYLTFTASDFVVDDAFLRHQLHPNQESSRFWNDWLAQHPEKQESWQQAVQLLEAVQMGLDEYIRTYLSPEAEANLLSRIQATNAAFEETPEVVPLWNRPWSRYAAIACFIVLAGALFRLYQHQSSSVSPYQRYVATLSESRIEKINENAQPILVRLPDGSQVTLFPKSRLSYDDRFGQENRSVYLSGKAFFDVVKQPQKPFFVYANELVTKVLGTSFTVQAYPEDKRVEVQVRTGKVSVFTQNDPQKQKMLDNSTLEGIVLTPNQQITLHRQELRFSKALVPKPELLIPSTQAPLFEFDETSVPEVFALIEKAYGVNIVYDEELLSSCTITASLTEESLAEKIQLICQGIGAKSEIIDAQIIIYSKGCK